MEMSRPNPNLFVDDPLDRVGVLRKDPEWCAAQRTHPDATLIPLHKGGPLLDPQTGSLQWLSQSAIEALPPHKELILLGLDDERRPHFTADATGEPPLFSELGSFTPLRDAAMGGLSPTEAAIAGHAAWLIDWHRRNRFCARYGTETVIGEQGAKRINPDTGTEHFPRTDPVAIMLPTHGAYACLGRSPHFPEGMMSAMAGFVEACETLEACAIRELKEEVGLTATKVEYIFSQPWPFPSSLMVGFLVEVADRTLELDPDEIADAQWFSKAELRALLAGGGPGGVFVPPPIAIAHQLLKVWVDR